MTRVARHICAVDCLADLRQPRFVNDDELIILDRNLSPYRALAIERGNVERRPEMPDVLIRSEKAVWRNPDTINADWRNRHR